MYLHEDKEKFKELIEQVSEETGKTVVVIEKDYYVTMILRLLSKELPNVVFKGGTSLSKGFKAINRFSEDIDITFDEHIGEARRKKLKNNIIKGISETLNMPISIGVQRKATGIIMYIIFLMNLLLDCRMTECFSR